MNKIYLNVNPKIEDLQLLETSCCAADQGKTVFVVSQIQSFLLNTQNRRRLTLRNRNKEGPS